MHMFSGACISSQVQVHVDSLNVLMWLLVSMQPADQDLNTTLYLAEYNFKQTGNDLLDLLADMAPAGLLPTEHECCKAPYQARGALSR